MIKLNKDIHDFADIFAGSGHELYLVGGALRNMVAGLKPSDYDFATDAPPEEVIKMFRRVIPTGMQHGTVTVLYRKNSFEVTTFRVDGEYSNARHPDSIEYTSDIYEDLKRRDFTINAMAYNIITKEFIDPHNGKIDLKKRIIKAIGIPEERFSEDGLRLIRACRFASQLGFAIEKKTLQGMKRLSENISRVSAERIMDEISKIMSTDCPSTAFRLMLDTDILARIIPELSACRNVEQSGVHKFDVFEHSIYSCDAAPADNQGIRLAALLHDIGKPVCKSADEEGFFHFYNHEKVSSEMASDILKRLKFPNKTIEKVCHLILHHMFNYTDEWTDSAVRRFISRVGADKVNELLMLRQADQYGFAAQAVLHDSLAGLKDRIDQIMKKDSAFSVRDLAVNGRDLMESLHADPGPMIGVILGELLETVLDDPEQNKREILLKIAEKKYHSLTSG